MIIKEPFYAVECDVCGEHNENYDGVSFWGDENISEEMAADNDWHKGDSKNNIGEDGKHYCPNCFMFDDSDVFVLKEKALNK
ncbi:MAG: hypothetical protein V4549_18095 [Bacteroidota bacterium]